MAFVGSRLRRCTAALEKVGLGLQISTGEAHGFLLTPVDTAIAGVTGYGLPDVKEL